MWIVERTPCCHERFPNLLISAPRNLELFRLWLHTSRKSAEFSATVALTRPTQPHLVVMERRAAIRRDRVGAGQRVDAAAVGVGRIGPHRFRDQHAAAHAVE